MSSKPYRALVLDDEESIRAILEMTLEPPDWQTRLAATVAEASALLSSETFDVVICDKNLPDGDGVAFVRLVRERQPDAACVMITAFPSVTSAVDTLNLEIDDYLVKPFDIVELPAKLRGLIEQRQKSERKGSLSDAKAHFLRVREHLEKARGLPGGTRLSIVLVLTNASDRAQLESLLKAAGNEVATFVTSASALAMPRGPVDLIVADAAVTAPDVFGLFEGLTAAGGDPDLVVIADDPKLDTVTRLMKLDLALLINKPIERDALSAQIGAVAERARRRRESGAGSS